MFTKKIFTALLLAPLFVGCVVTDGDDDDGADTGDTDPTAATMTDPTAATMTDPTAATMTDPSVGTDSGSESGSESADTGVDSGSSDGTGGGDGLLCQQPCAEAVDCCPPETPDCPGDYPWNITCEEGACVYGGCVTDDHCAAIAGTTCEQFGGFGTCLPLCASDKECLAEFEETCTGMTDDGETYCVAPPVLCESDADCDFGLCNLEDGSCGTCAESTDCPKGYECQ